MRSSILSLRAKGAEIEKLIQPNRIKMLLVSARNLGLQNEAVEAIYRKERAHVLSTLIRLLGDFDLAQDAMQSAFIAAVENWPKDGTPVNPRSWLISTGRFKAIDAIRRESRLSASLHDLAKCDLERQDPFPVYDPDQIEDDRLRLIFTCCHPTLSGEGKIALTLREVCGLSTEEIAKAFLCPVPTVAQRIVRAKSKIRHENIPYEIPAAGEMRERTKSVLQVIYLLFNEGYYASSGENLTRHVLSSEAIRLGRLLSEILPGPEVFGLLGMMLLNESRRQSRVSSSGDIVLFADQDRSLWDESLIEEGLFLCDKALSSGKADNYVLQAGIAATHVQGAIRGKTDWNRIVDLYDLLLAENPSPVVELNRAAAVSMRDGPFAGLAAVDRILAKGELQGYGLAHAARADCCRRLGLYQAASEAYSIALGCTEQLAERRFLASRLREMSDVLERVASKEKL